MSIKISWVNRNTQAVTTTIYRGDAELDRANLPAPLATLTAGETQYVDQTAVQGNTYYYVFKTTSGSETIISRNQKLQATDTRGPGSSAFLYGNRELGLYDTLPVDSFITSVNLNAMLGNVVATPISNTMWYKYARRGKVIMVPEKSLGYGGSLSYNTLLAKGLVDGTTVVQIAGFNWKVRLMRGWNEIDSVTPLPASALGPVDMQTVNQTCEFNDFVYPMAGATPTNQRLPTWLQQNVTSLYSTYGNYIYVQEKTLEGDRCVLRTIGAINTNERTKLAGANSIALATTGSSNGWWPVLELVEA